MPEINLNLLDKKLALAEYLNLKSVIAINKKDLSIEKTEEISKLYQKVGYKTVDKVKKGDSMIAIEKLKNGWTKVRTSLGNIGYTKNITNIYTVREQMESNE